MFAGDLDSDGDVDLALGEAIGSFQLGWIENTGGAPGTWAAHTVATLASARSVTIADLDGDGDQDLAATNATAGLAWYRNATIHSQACFVPRTISTAVAGARAVVPADVDGDSDLDVVSAAFQSNTVHWHENAAGDASS